MQSFVTCLGFCLGAFIYCEFLGDYHRFLECSWPRLPSLPSEQLHAMILSDTHLLGPFHGHWLDKLYREWHMHRAFQVGVTLLKPKVVFVLGDLFDEGDMVQHEQFDEYVARFWRHFYTPPDVPLISAAGNHDIGFHYKMTPFLSERFKAAFNNTGVQLYTFMNVHFVVINSMAMENDDCDYCRRALDELQQVNKTLEDMKQHKTQHLYSQPIVMQHFPTYRVSNEVCKERDESLPITALRENWHVLSKSSTEILGKYLQPRLMFAGHDHFYCLNVNELGVEEYTVPSFSWRNNVKPSFLLATLTPHEYAVSKCDMLEQSMVYVIYVMIGLVCLGIFLIKLVKTLYGVKNKKA